MFKEFVNLTPLPPAPTTQEQEVEEIDEELLEIFLEEAREVLDTIAGHIDAIRPATADPEALTVVRRGFHTLKGSGRMVGLT
ncbi:Hpt domain-containing protein, partial [Arthrospira platensis SPKY1]|nr:Hpt domain-containing protein [Arthrospira platensis SPKY1]